MPEKSQYYNNPFDSVTSKWYSDPPDPPPTDYIVTIALKRRSCRRTPLIAPFCNTSSHQLGK